VCVNERERDAVREIEKEGDTIKEKERGKYE
jgi:hypothetical protein